MPTDANQSWLIMLFEHKLDVFVLVVCLVFLLWALNKFVPSVNELCSALAKVISNEFSFKSRRMLAERLNAIYVVLTFFLMISTLFYLSPSIKEYIAGNSNDNQAVWYLVLEMIVFAFVIFISFRWILTYNNQQELFAKAKRSLPPRRPL